MHTACIMTCNLCKSPWLGIIHHLHCTDKETEDHRAKGKTPSIHDCWIGIILQRLFCFVFVCFRLFCTAVLGEDTEVRLCQSCRHRVHQLEQGWESFDRDCATTISGTVETGIAQPPSPSATSLVMDSSVWFGV